MKTSMLKQFEDIIGFSMFSTFLDMLKAIGPDARTERISIVIASMLQYALRQLPADCDDGSLGEALIALDEEPYLAAEHSDEYQCLAAFIDQLCKKAGMQNERQNSRGICYSIAENAISQYVSWYNMPWEDSVC
jgi:hypothetical protein